jgi:predicted DsbA family dithiol-disulfide isomerase
MFDRPSRALMSLEITLFTDPACPFAFSAEPARLRLRWHYGDQLQWSLRMIVLTLEPGEAERLAEGAPVLQRRFGMPIDPAPYPRTFSSEPACRAVVAAGRNAPQRQARLLRALRVRTMAGGLLDDPDLIAGAARDAGVDADRLAAWMEEPETRAALDAEIKAARMPTRAARALDHKLGGPREQRRYTAPSYVMRRADRTAAATLPGFHPVEAYEAAIANLAPELERARKPADVEELLKWASVPLATAEVVAIMQQSEQRVRAALATVAQPAAVGADAYWSLA